MTKKQLLKQFEKLPVSVIEHALEYAQRLKKQLDYQKTPEYIKLQEEENKKKEEFREMWINSPG